LEKVDLSWNHNGSILAVIGHDCQSKQVKVMFYTPNLVLVNTLDLQITTKSHISWEGSGQRICVASESSLYFLSVKYAQPKVSNTTHLIMTRTTAKQSYLSIIDVQRGDSTMHPTSNLIHSECFNNNILTVQSNMELKIMSLNGEVVSSTIVYFRSALFAMDSRRVLYVAESNVYVWSYGCQCDTIGVISSKIEQYAIL
jgi:hypothetical protein